MDNSGIYVGLDVGTTTIKVVVAEHIKGQINVLGSGNVPSAGVQRGIIVDINKAARAIRKAISQAEEKASIQIHKVIVGIPAYLLKIEPCSGMIAISDESREINDDDVRNVTSAAMIKNLPPERQIVDAIPDEFIVDGFDGIQDPRGMVGVRLEMRGHIFTGPKTLVHNTMKAVTNAGLQITSFTVNPLAQGQVLLDDGEQDFGTVLLDIGGGQTTGAVIHNHQLQYTTVDNEGGDYITKDISVVLNTSIESAEKLKRNYGYADSFDLSKNNKFPVTVVGQSKPIQVSEKMLSQIIQARLEQIFGRIKKQLDRVSALSLPGGIVLTGGVAALPGVSELAADFFNTNVKVYIPDQMGLRHPSYAVPLALVTYQAHLSQVDFLVRSTLVRVSGRAPRVYHQQQMHQRPSQPSFNPDVLHVAHQTQTTNPTSTSAKKKHHFNTDGIKKFFNDFFD